MLYLQSVTPRNMLSFGPNTPPLELKDLNVFIGPNGAGKTNMMRILYSLCCNTEGPFVKVSVFESFSREDCALVDMELRMVFKGIESVLNLSAERTATEIEHSVLRWSGLRYLSFSLVPSKNAAVYLSRHRSKNPLTRARLNRVQDRLLLYLKDFSRLIEPVLYGVDSPKSVKTRVLDLHIEKYISENWLWYIKVLAVLLDPEPPSVIFIDDIDAGLHLDLLPGLADLVVQASERSQVFITTQSHVILDAIDDTDKGIESVVVFDMRNQPTTTMERLTLDIKQNPMFEEGLGCMWSRGAIGGVVW